MEKSGLYKTSDLYIAAWLLSKGLKPTMDNGFGGKEYEIDKKRIRPPRAPIKLSADTRAKLATRLRQSRDFTSQNTKLQAKSGAKSKTRVIPLTGS